VKPVVVEKLPIVVAIDVEPDPRILGRHQAERLSGFEKLLSLVEPLRHQLGELCGAPVRFTWLVRIDPQIAEVYGSPTALVSMYGSELETLQTSGDEVGIHQHAWRWLHGWVADQADPAWVAHCTAMGLTGYREAFGAPCRAFSFGDGFMSTALARQLDDAGLVVDLTIEPGLTAVHRDLPTEEATGWRPDTRTVAAFAYRPSRDDFRTPDLARTSGLLLIPRTPGLTLSMYQVGDRLVPGGRYQTLNLWTAPETFSEMLGVRLDAQGVTHLSFGLRTDIALLSDEWAALETNLLTTARRLGERARWSTASDAADLVAPRLAAAAAVTRDRESAGAGRWLLGTGDPGFREGVDAEQLDVGAIPLSDVPAVPLNAQVSAILPVFNGARHLREAVESVVDQTEPPDELVVVDDGSTDDCVEFLHGVSAPFPIRIVRQPNAGQSAARNFGARVARGGLLAFLDQDDRWHPRHLAVLRSSLRDEPIVGWSYCDFDEVDAEGHVVTRSFLRSRGVEHPKSSLTTCVASDLMVLPSASVVRREAFDALGGFDETLQGYEDDDLYVRTFRSGWHFSFHPEPLVAFRVHGASHSARSGFAASRLRFAKKLEATIRDDPRMNRYYFRDIVAPRFFQTSLDDYVRATSARDWEAAKGLFESLRYFGSRLRHPPRWKLVVIRNPRGFRVLLRLHDRVPRALRLTRNPILRLR
jgi:glycosyltransferase involved in cell wall biosynthesis